MAESGLASDIIPSTRAEAVANRLRSMIISGELEPGTPLRQLDVAEQFAVSTTPVREAFASLALEGFVRQTAHRGVEVFRPSLEDIRENYEIRLALEPLAAELAAPNMTDEVVEKLESLCERMENATEFKLGTILNREFHTAIYEQAGRPKLYELVDRLRHAADAYVHLMSNQVGPGYREQVLAEHRDILAALAKRSGPAARKAMTAHLKHSVDQIREVLEQRRDPAEAAAG